MRTLRQGRTYFALEFASEFRTIAVALALVLAGFIMGASVCEAQNCAGAPLGLTNDSMSGTPSANTSLPRENRSVSRTSVSPAGDTTGSDDDPRESIDRSVPVKKSRSPQPDFNRQIYYRNKLEFSFEVGWLPVNIPFPFDVFEGDPYDLYPIRYTLVPVMASLRWHLGDPWGPPVLRGNWDLTFSASATVIPRGPETHYFSYDMGLRRNFIPRNWRVTPYWDVRAGVGYINAKGPLGVYYAQGQNFTFNINMGAGARYNLNRRYAISAGLNWMHISNGNLSSPAYSNYGINVYGPMIGLDIQLRPNSRQSE